MLHINNINNIKVSLPSTAIQQFRNSQPVILNRTKNQTKMCTTKTLWVVEYHRNEIRNSITSLLHNRDTTDPSCPAFSYYQIMWFLTHLTVCKQINQPCWKNSPPSSVLKWQTGCHRRKQNKRSSMKPDMYTEIFNSAEIWIFFWHFNQGSYTLLAANISYAYE